MINLQKLRYLSCVCAYCGKVMPMNERTNDHIIPRCANGQTESSNIVICCKDCNCLKANTLINEFLEKYPKKKEYFYNYLNMIDCQMGSNEYSEAILNVLSESLKMSYKRKKRQEKNLKNKKKKGKYIVPTKPEDIQNIEYRLNLSGKPFFINEIQAKIMDYYIKNPNFSDYKTLAESLGISRTRFISEICCINNLTGIFKLKNVSKNGIIFNDLLCEVFHDPISKV